MKQTPGLSAIIPVSDLQRNWCILSKTIEEAVRRNIVIIICLAEENLSSFDSLAKNLTVIDSEMVQVCSGKFNTQGSARNAGLSRVKTEWVCFWDCDDSPNIDKILGAIELEENGHFDSDLIIGGIKVVEPNKGYFIEIPDQEVSQKFFQKLGTYPAFTRIIYRHSKLGVARFADLKFGEDICFLSKLFSTNLAIRTSNEIFYTYLRGHPAAMTSNYSNYSAPEIVISTIGSAIRQCTNSRQLEFQISLLTRQYLAILRNRSSFGSKSFSASTLMFIKLFSKHPTRISLAMIRITSTKFTSSYSNENPTEVFVFGGLGNQLFQLAAGLYVSRNQRLHLNASSNTIRSNSSAELPINDFILPKNVATLQNGSNKNSGRYNWVLNFLLKLSSKGRTTLASRILFGFTPFYKYIVQVSTPKLFLSDGVGFDPRLQNQTTGSSLIGCFHSYMWARDPNVLHTIRSLKLKKSPDWLINHAEMARFEKPIIVHIRRGDYANIPELGFLDIEFYIRAMKLALAKSPGSKFWIFSDDFDYVQANLPNDLAINSRFIQNDPDNASAHLELMRYGHNYVLSNSTFSWWGATLSYQMNPLVIAAKNWFATKDNPYLLLPPDWVLIKSRDTE